MDKSGNFSTKSGKFSTSAECSNSCNSAKKIFFFCKFFKVENFPPKWKKVQFYPLGMKFGKREGLDAENKISPKWKFFHQKWKIFDLCRMFQFMQFCKKIFFFCKFFKVENFPPKWKKVQFYPLGMKFGKREGLDAENKISPKWKFFHQKWKIFDLCRMFQFMQFCKKNFFFLQIFQSGKFSTKVEKSPILSIGDEIWQTRRSRCRKQNFTKVEIFPPKVENFPPLQNVPIHAILQKNFFFFANFSKVENFPPKWKKFQIFPLGMKFGK